MSTNIKVGSVLLAEPFMLDPNFKRTTVLLVDHSAEGSVGFIMNRKMEISVDELIDDFPEFEAPVYFGGPVGADTVHYLHCRGDLLSGSDEVVKNVFWGGDFRQLKTLINNKLIKPSDIRFFVGYSGWSDRQLEEELELGSWVPAKMDANYLFSSEPDSLWKQVMENKGSNFAVIADMEEGASYN
ncbi:YqgE/AlgH family protein [Neolewinella antarctica]|uniref:Transcriptional regulator n=1 Tax=Neolewinella antarctica TaxID=442734 RepID=A0ABX0X6N9_9BACT|nr:YqgE/AlgH family protein [Neolewinella antarctica]NJC24880.1 putative transcriptional regulator [Neolewinella antarctica]